MKYLGVWIVVVWVYHFSICGFAVFVNWDASYFWLSNWNGPSRIAYIMMLALISVGVAIWASEEAEARGENKDTE